MYGWINDCIEKFFISGFGIEIWEKIKNAAGITHPDGYWKAKMYYPDGSTYIIIEAGARVTNNDISEVCLSIAVTRLFAQYSNF